MLRRLLTTDIVNLIIQKSLHVRATYLSFPLNTFHLIASKQNAEFRRVSKLNKNHMQQNFIKINASLFLTSTSAVIDKLEIELLVFSMSVLLPTIGIRASILF